MVPVLAASTMILVGLLLALAGRPAAPAQQLAKVAEVDGNRTRRTGITGPTRFEARGTAGEHAGQSVEQLQLCALRVQGRRPEKAGEGR